MGDGLIDPDVVATRVARHLVPNPRGRPRGGAPHPIDVAFGARVRARRILLGMSQERLGELLGISFQQVQKYETGADRVSVSRLFAVAAALACPPAQLIEGLAGPAPDGGAADPADPARQASERATLEIAKAIAAVRDPAIRTGLHGLARACAERVR